MSVADAVLLLAVDSLVTWLGGSIAAGGHVGALVVMGVIGATTVGYLAWRGVWPLAGMSPATLTGPAVLVAVGTGVALQGAQWVFVAWLRIMGGWVHPYIPWWAVPQSLVGVGWASVVAVIVAAPVVEELVFRGVVYTVLRRHLGVGGAVVASALVFAAVHPGDGLLFVMLLGVAAALLYERTGSLWSAIAVHATFNGIVIGAGMVIHSVGGIPGTYWG